MHLAPKPERSMSTSTKTSASTQQQPQQTQTKAQQQKCQMPDVYKYDNGCPSDCALCTAVPVKDEQGNVHLVCIPNVQQNSDGTYTVNDTCGKLLVTIDVDGTVKPNEDNPLAQQFVQKLMEVAKQEQMSQPECQPSCPDWYICTQKEQEQTQEQNEGEGQQTQTEQQEQKQTECECDEGYTKVKVKVPKGTVEICVNEKQIQQNEDGSYTILDTCGNPVITVGADGTVSVAQNAKDSQLAVECYQQMMAGINRWLAVQKQKGPMAGLKFAGSASGTASGTGAETSAIVQQIIEGIAQIVQMAQGAPNVQVQIDVGKVAEAIAEAVAKIEEVRVQAQIEMKKMEMEQKREEMREERQEMGRGQQMRQEQKQAEEQKEGEQRGQQGQQGQKGGAQQSQPEQKQTQEQKGGQGEQKEQKSEQGQPEQKQEKKQEQQKLTVDVEVPDKKHECRCPDGYEKIKVLDDQGNDKYICVKRTEVRRVDDRYVIVIETAEGRRLAVAEVFKDGTIAPPSWHDARRIGAEIADVDVCNAVIEKLVQTADNSECRPGGGFLPFLGGFQQVQPVEEQKSGGIVDDYKKAVNDARKLISGLFRK